MAKILNTFFISLTFALGCFCWVYYITKQSQLAIIAGITIAALTVAISLKLSKRTKKHKKISRKTYSDFALYLCTHSEADALIDKLLAYLNYTVEQAIDDNTLLTNKEGKRILVAKQLTVAPVNADSILGFVKTARKHGITNVTLLCTQVDAKSFATVKAVNDVAVSIVNCEQLYDTLQKCEMLPQIVKAKYALSDNALLCYAFNRARARYYLTSAFFLLVMSLVAFFPLYFLIWATILMAAAIYSRFNRRFNVAVARLPL